MASKSDFDMKPVPGKKYHPAKDKCTRCGMTITWDFRVQNENSGKWMPGHLDDEGNVFKDGDCPKLAKKNEETSKSSKNSIRPKFTARGYPLSPKEMIDAIKTASFWMHRTHEYVHAALDFLHEFPLRNLNSEEYAGYFNQWGDADKKAFLKSLLEDAGMVWSDILKKINERKEIFNQDELTTLVKLCKEEKVEIPFEIIENEENKK